MSYNRSRLPQHECTEKCKCPIHKTNMYYWPGGDLHACVDSKCEFADGVSLEEFMPYHPINNPVAEESDKC